MFKRTSATAVTVGLGIDETRGWPTGSPCEADSVVKTGQDRERE
jgi:hypothetical protein